MFSIERRSDFDPGNVCAVLVVFVSICNNGSVMLHVHISGAPIGILTSIGGVFHLSINSMLSLHLYHVHDML